MKKIIDKKLFLYLLIFYIFYNTINILKNSYLKINGLIYKDVSWADFFYQNIVFETLFNIPIIIYIIIVTKKLIDTKYSRMKGLVIHILSWIISVILSFIVFNFVYAIKINDFSITTLTSDIISNAISTADRTFLIYFGNVFIIGTYYYFNKVSKIELQKTKLKQQLTNAQISVLKYQLHPHFFFNTLNSISALIEIDAKLAQNTLADFSDLLRDLIFLKDSNLMPLSLEMKILKKYIDIMSIRFSDHLKVNINIAENLENILIPTLILQPIVENSFKYGYSYNSTDLEINIEINIESPNLNITIENNGEALTKPIKYGTGLKNTIDRLQTFYGDNYTFNIDNTSFGVKTTLILPSSPSEKDTEKYKKFEKLNSWQRFMNKSSI